MGRLGVEALAALNASSFFVWLIQAQLMVVSIGTASVIADEVGAQRTGAIDRTATQALVFALCFSALLCLIGQAIHRPVLIAMGLEPGVVEQGSAYLRIIFLILPLMAVDQVMGAVYRGCGDTVTPTLVWSGVVLANLAFLPVLVGGWGGFVSPLGVAGAALSTALAMALGLLAYLALYARGRFPARLAWGALRHLDNVREVVRIGLPTSFNASVFCLVYMGLTRVLGLFGTPAVAAVGIGHRVESICYLVSVSLATATVTLVGQSKGAGDLDRAARCAWGAVGFAVAFSFVWSLGMIFFCVPLAQLFSRDAQVLQAASAYIRIIGFAQMFASTEIVLEGAFSGAGDTLPPMLIGVPLTLVRVPAAWLVAAPLGLGVSGVWWVITVLAVIRAALMAAWFHRGDWRRARGGALLDVEHAA